ncbi:MAG: nucleotidyl transferase AbiEii/AbiGii toxin family protein [Cyanobacteriota bacterium]
MNIHLDEKAFKALITNTANFLKMNQAFIEKDYWITFVLKKLSKSQYKDNFIFKGGTSLSKAYKIIERFSEDVDLAVVVSESLSNNQLKNLIDTTSKELTKDLEEIYLDGFTSKHSRFRKTAHKYPIITESTLYGNVLTNLILEINSFAQPHPNQMMEIESYITSFLKSADQEEFIKKHELESFHIRVLGLERTLGEKILALIRASHNEKPIEQLKSKIRHIYDIYMILQNPEMKNFLESQNFFRLLTAVQADDAKNSEFQGDWTKEKLSNSLIFGEIGVWHRKLRKGKLNRYKYDVSLV